MSAVESVSSHHNGGLEWDLSGVTTELLDGDRMGTAAHGASGWTRSVHQTYTYVGGPLDGRRFALIRTPCRYRNSMGCPRREGRPPADEDYYALTGATTYTWTGGPS
jgi:hypothetical protein